MLLCTTSIFQLSTYLALTIKSLMLTPATTLLSFPLSSPRSSKCPFLNLSRTCWWKPDPTGDLTSGESCSGTPGSGHLYSHPNCLPVRLAPVHQILQQACPPPLPLSEHILCRFAAVMSQTVTWGTIRSYLSALRFFQIRCGLPDPFLSSLPHLTYVLKGIQQVNTEHQRKHHLPVTMHMLLALHGVWSKPPVTYDNVMLWAACCLGIFGFLRG